MSDEQQYDFCREAGEPVDQPEYCGGPALYSARHVRDFYERLIDEGRLRVVEEVDSIPIILGVTMSAKCSGCGLRPLMFNFAYCPGCGNEIKR